VLLGVIKKSKRKEGRSNAERHQIERRNGRRKETIQKKQNATKRNENEDEKKPNGNNER